MRTGRSARAWGARRLASVALGAAMLVAALAGAASSATAQREQASAQQAMGGIHPGSVVVLASRPGAAPHAQAIHYLDALDSAAPGDSAPCRLTGSTAAPVTEPTSSADRACEARAPPAAGAV